MSQKSVASAPSDAVRPALAFRVGVTGTRRPAPDALAEIEAQIEAALALVREELFAAALRPEILRAYRNAPDGTVTPEPSVLSPLAEGADRLVADAGLRLGFRLDVALPFPRAEYEQDFKGGTLDAWLGPKGAQDEKPYFALDGAHGDEANRSYEAVGRLVVRNCDLLIAVWNGEPAAGRGGTAEIVRFSARFGPPVWWIDASGRNPPHFVRSVADLRWPEDAPAGEEAEAALRAALRAAIEPPARHDAHSGHAHGPIDAALKRLGLRNAFETDPYGAFLSEKPLPKRLVWRLHERVFRAPPPPDAAAVAAAPTAVTPAGETRYWEAIYARADRASVGYRDRYRSSYVWVFFLAGLAAICATLALASKGLKPYASGVEFLALAAILGLVAVNLGRAWHGRWIAYRLLAELCRKQEALAAFGWSLPPANVHRLGAARPAERWIGWYFNAAQRAAALPTGALDTERVKRERDFVLRRLVEGQVEYHRNRKVASAYVGGWMVSRGEWLFLATVLCVAIKLMFMPFHLLHGAVIALGVLAALAPTASAVLVGLRAYSEVQLLERQSARMEEVMTAAKARIDRMRLDRPLASQDLATEVFDLAAEMMQDVGGWADLFRVKAVEAG
ncbi:hypothetical protein [Methylopila sp. M107]|uniref:hypothetical protein n=1 Tax=Methylopila sp. M107 TaxID=1101190 RepID=UPI000370F1E7|nr:hypothetical protein [Methylopila sp. M107]